MQVKVIYGPPGTGKTSELLREMKLSCDNGTEEEGICFVSFTKAAAKEMADRAGLSRANVSTIHSLAYRVVGMSRDQVINKKEYKEFSRITGFEFTGANPGECEQIGLGDYFLSLYSLYKNLLHEHPRQTIQISSREGSPREFEFFVKKYEEFKGAYGIHDFTDMLTLALDFDAPEFEYMFVDEAQDLSPLQWKLVRHWVKQIPKIWVAGDDDQSLYNFGGADPAGMFKFAEKYRAESKVLKQSYRIPKSVYNLAIQVISNIKNRVDKDYLPRNKNGLIRKFNSPYALPVPAHGEDVLFLYRNHSLREEFEQILIDNAIPYVIDSGEPGYFYSPLARAIRSLITATRDYKKTGQSYLKSGERKNLAKFCPKYLVDIQDQNFGFMKGKNWAKVLIGPMDQTYYLQSIEKKGQLFEKPTIHMSTIHGSKGREADRVVLLNALGGRSLEKAQSDPDSEIRNFYVGITRSKNILDIVYGQNALNYF
jgi:DNA helicase-2/ATP-dependent DNA helicase PcrA